MELLAFLHEYHLIQIVPFVGFILYLTIKNNRSKRNGAVRRSNRSTSRTSEYYSTEVDEL
ncbi:hypothetical protein Z946_907 [Sulfitobacter noctilucicola]|uniref:Uncharacterized protein n=1 Tax=Sulfitobacter noctilucicola TaxID=1342301 RepID=A0A7W6M6U9_9RHOB|nr:hypothetical protein [Sulfitobacter noctilucicola]KIN62051.1 hypothetical protein Z946_907 [Sulfitobacter noctilucicola]MBB4173431.1 hypothetical protein [Sulfitobacter noctilucicola]